MFCLGTLVVASLLAPFPATLTAKLDKDWAQFLGPNQDGKSDATGILKDWSQGKLQVEWKFELSESYGIGSIHSGKYYQLDRVDGNEKVICLDALTGEELWQFSYPVEYRDLYGYNNGPRCSPLVDAKNVYSFGVTGVLHCLDKNTGELNWRVDTSSEYGVLQNFFGVGSTPVLHNDNILVMVGGSPDDLQSLPPGRLDLAKGNGTGIVAFNRESGEEVYRLSNELASYSSLKLANMLGRDWCFALTRGGLLAFHPSTGAEDFFLPWRARTLESVNASMPVVFDNQVFISETYGPGSCLLRIALDDSRETGEGVVVWKDDPRVRKKAMQTHWNTAVYHNGYLYGSSGRHSYDAELRCIDAKTGEVQWSEPGLSRSSLLYVDGHFIVLTENGQLLLIKASPSGFETVTEFTPTLREESGAERRLINPPAWAAPIIWNGRLYVRGDDYLVCLALIPE